MHHCVEDCSETNTYFRILQECLRDSDGLRDNICSGIRHKMQKI